MQETMPRDELDTLVKSTLNRLEHAFLEIAKDNVPSHMTVTRKSDFELEASIKNVGPYRFYIDETTNFFSM